MGKGQTVRFPFSLSASPFPVQQKTPRSAASREPRGVGFKSARTYGDAMRQVGCKSDLSDGYQVGRDVTNVELAFVPIERIAVKHTITINANITAYSTAVGPSSETRKRCTFRARLFIASSDSRADSCERPYHPTCGGSR